MYLPSSCSSMVTSIQYLVFVCIVFKKKKYNYGIKCLLEPFSSSIPHSFPVTPDSFPWATEKLLHKLPSAWLLLSCWSMQVFLCSPWRAQSLCIWGYEEMLLLVSLSWSLWKCVIWPVGCNLTSSTILEIIPGISMNYCLCSVSFVYTHCISFRYCSLDSLAMQNI